jgi:phosphogluconate dehydratase
VFGADLAAYAREPWLDGEELAWRDPGPSGDETILRGAADPFQPDGGMRLLEGNLGRAVFKTSAVDRERWTVEAPCRVFDSQAAVARAFAAGEFDRDVVVVVRFQGPRANGMPELHKLTPVLGVVQDRGHKVALVTDGRMSGASGKVPSAIHVSPEALEKEGVWGPLALLRDGDIVRISAEDGTLSTSADLTGREPAEMGEVELGTGRELFGMFRAFADEAERGASAMLAEGGL